MRADKKKIPGASRQREKALKKRGVTNLLAIMARLRGPSGCPWDKEQTANSLKRFLI